MEDIEAICLSQALSRDYSAAYFLTQTYNDIYSIADLYKTNDKEELKELEKIGKKVELFDEQTNQPFCISLSALDNAYMQTVPPTTPPDDIYIFTIKKKDGREISHEILVGQLRSKVFLTWRKIRSIALVLAKKHNLSTSAMGAGASTEEDVMNEIS